MQSAVLIMSDLAAAFRKGQDMTKITQITQESRLCIP